MQFLVHSFIHRAHLAFTSYASRIHIVRISHAPRIHLAFTLHSPCIHFALTSRVLHQRGGEGTQSSFGVWVSMPSLFFIFCCLYLTKEISKSKKVVRGRTLNSQTTFQNFSLARWQAGEIAASGTWFDRVLVYRVTLPCPARGP